MSLDLATILTSGGYVLAARKVENIIARNTPADMLHILTIVADNTLHRIKSERERQVMGAFFIKELQLRVALREYSDAERQDTSKRQEHDALTVEHRYAQYDDSDSLASCLVDICCAYRYRAILQGVPMAVSQILRDYPKDRDRNNMLLDTIQLSTCRRFHLKPQAVTLELKSKAEPLIKRLKAISDDRRCAAVLEVIDLLAKLVEADD